MTSRLLLITLLIGLLNTYTVRAATLDISIATLGTNDYNNLVADAKLRGDTIGALQDANLGNISGGGNRFYANYLADGTTLSSRMTHFLQRFDVSSIPPGSTISSATLTTYFANQSANNRTFTNVSLSRLLPGKDWVEGVGQNPATDGSVTWNHQKANTVPWATAGATGVLDIDQATTQMFDVVGVEGSPTAISRTITSWVQDWVNNPTNNNGMLWWGGSSLDSDSGNRYFFLGSKEDGEGPPSDSAAAAPTLVIEYTTGGDTNLVTPNITDITLQKTPAIEYCWTNFAGSLTADGDSDGTGSGALFSGLYGIDINGAGTMLFVADRGASKIKSISIPGAVVTTVLAQADLTELVVDKVNGNIYFTTQGAGTINRLAAPAYTTVTEIGSGVASFALGIDSAADILYVSGISSGSIYYISNASSATPEPLTLLAGDGASQGFADGTLTEARFNAPMGIAISGTGTNAILYVGDRDNDAIRKIDLATGMVTTVAGHIGRGCGPGQVAGPHGVWLGTDGNLYVPGQESYTVIKVALPSGEVTHIGGLCGTAGAADGCGSEALNGNVSQVTMDGAGNIYTVDRGGINAADHARVSKGSPVAVAMCNVQIDFTAGATDTAGQFTLQRSSPNVGGPYNDVAATITTLSAGSFRAVVPCGTGPEFYRIRR